MIQNNILINTETRALKNRDYDFLGVAGENEIEQLVFKLTAFIDGIGIIEIQKDDEKFFIELDKQEETYVLNVKNSLLSDVEEVSMQLHITTENTEIFKSKIFTMKVYEQIHATETIPDEYPEWIDTANAMLQHVVTVCEEYNTETEQYRNETQQLKNETEEIKNAARDFVSAVTFAKAETNPVDGHLYFINEESLGNMGFEVDSNGHLIYQI